MKESIKLTIVLTMSLLFASCSSGGSDDSGDTPGISDDVTKNVILALTCIPENDTTSFVYNYAENINDGRGITFGIIGFTSGTFDGTELLKLIRKKDSSNPLCAYIPAFETIDNLTHVNGHTDNVTGLVNFINDFNSYGNDRVVKEAQLELLDEFYWDPAMVIAETRGIKLNITKGQIYDACIRHGSSDARKIAELTDAAVGSPSKGGNEIDWLKHYFVERKKLYEKEGDTGVIPRIDVLYQGILDSGNLMLIPPFDVKCNDAVTAYTITGEKP